MPCYQISRTSVKLKAENEETLLAGLQAEGSGFSRVVKYASYIQAYHNETGRTMSIKNGAINIDSDVADDVANAVNRAYSNQVVRETAKRYGWAIKQTAPGKLQVIKRF